MARIIASNTIPGTWMDAGAGRPRPPNAPLTPARPTPPAQAIPTIMYDAVTAQSAGEQVFRADAFKNTSGVPMEIHGMRIMMEYVAPTVAPASNSLLVDAGGVIALRAAVNGVPMTRGYVPVWNICRTDNRLDLYRGNGVYSYSMNFANPIVLSPGASISLQAKHLGFTPASIKVHASFVGRRGAGLNSPRRVPYVVYWQSPNFGYTTAATFTTPPSILVNDSGRQFNVDRIIGRFAAFSPVYPIVAWSATARVYLDWQDPTAQGVFAASLRLAMAQDRPIIPVFTQWRAVFGQSGAFETDFVMRPNDYMVADVRHVAGLDTRTTNPPPFFQASAGISLVGWREV